jgi:hypothetical protein
MAPGHVRASPGDDLSEQHADTLDFRLRNIFNPMGAIRRDFSGPGRNASLVERSNPNMSLSRPVDHARVIIAE